MKNVGIYTRVNGEEKEKAEDKTRDERSGGDIKAIQKDSRRLDAKKVYFEASSAYGREESRRRVTREPYVGRDRLTYQAGPTPQPVSVGRVP